MPKLPIIKDKVLIKSLKKLGFKEHRQSGSHLAMKHSNGLRTIIPIHAGKDLPRGILKAILRDAEITVEKLITLL